MLYKTFRPFF